MAISFGKLLQIVLDTREAEHGEMIDGEFFTRCDNLNMSEAEVKGELFKLTRLNP